MTKKISFLLPGAIALMVATAPFLAAHAQSPASLTQRPRQEFAQKLNLTDAQKAEMRRIQEQTQNQIRGVLTPEQQTQWDAAQQQGTKSRQLMRSLNLSESQRNQIREIKRASRQQMQSILTEEQRNQIQQRRSNRMKPQA